MTDVFGKSRLRVQIERLGRAQLMKNKVISLEEFRGLKKEVADPHVLVVDPDASFRHSAKRVLEGSGFSVSMAGDGLDLAHYIERFRIDAMVLAMDLPWVGGLELCGLLKADTELSATPVVLTSAQPMNREEMQGCYEVGADDVLPKPIEFQTLIESLNEGLLARAKLSDHPFLSPRVD